MLELLAIAREDGWAYVRTNDGISLVRPPYTLGDWLIADEQSIEKAIVHAGFIALRKEFDDWNRLIAFLKQQVVESRLEQRKMIPEVGPDPEELLAFAPTGQLVNFLNRIEVELIPNRAWEHAESILLAMLALPNVCADEQLVERTRKLLQKIVDARKTEDAIKRELTLPETPITEFDDQIEWLKNKKANNPPAFRNWIKKIERDIHKPPYAALCFYALYKTKSLKKGMEYLPLMAEYACTESPPFQLDVVLASFAYTAGRFFWQNLGNAIDKMSVGSRVAVAKALQKSGHGAIQIHSDSVILRDKTVIEVIPNPHIYGRQRIRPVMIYIDETLRWQSDNVFLLYRVQHYREEAKALDEDLAESNV